MADAGEAVRFSAGLIRLEALVAFLTVVECGSVTAASRVLFLSQPATSRRISQFEQQLGVALFRREAHLTLTPAGVSLVPASRGVLASLHELSAAAAAAVRG
jgi:DNA-binding transcriptional LysR family regulator